MKQAPIEEQFDLLRTKVEGLVKTSAVFVVTSACVGDGTSATAFGLATSFGSAGYVTLLIDANHVHPTISEERAPSSLEALASNGPRSFARPAVDGLYSTLSVVKETLRRNASRPGFLRVIEACRESYQVIVIDAGRLVDSNISMMLAKLADGVILTVREGRGIKRDDSQAVRAIETHELPVIGSVTISNSTIKDFEARTDRRASDVATLPAPDGAAPRQRSAVF